MEKILEGLDLDDFDGETAYLYGPQRAPFDIMDGRWALYFTDDTWQAVQFEDEDDPHGDIVLEGPLDPCGETLEGALNDPCT